MCKRCRLPLRYMGVGSLPPARRLDKLRGLAPMILGCLTHSPKRTLHRRPKTDRPGFKEGRKATPAWSLRHFRTKNIEARFLEARWPGPDGMQDARTSRRPIRTDG